MSFILFTLFLGDDYKGEESEKEDAFRLKMSFRPPEEPGGHGFFSSAISTAEQSM